MIARAASTLLLTICLAGFAQAADPVTPEQAGVIEGNLRQWLAETMGPQVVLPKRPVEVTAAGDHYDVAVPFVVLLGSAGTPAAGSGAMTGQIRPLDQSKWAIDNVRAPSPGHFAFDMGSPGKKMPVEVDMTIADQDSHGIFDQSFATPSTMNSTIGVMDLHLSSALQDQVQHIEGTTSQATMTPTTAGRVDLTNSVAAKGLSVVAHTSDDHSIRVTSEHVSVAGHLDDVDRSKLLAAFQVLTRMSGELTAAMQPPAKPVSAPPSPTRPGVRPNQAQGGQGGQSAGRVQPSTPARPAPADAAAQVAAKSLVRNMVLALRDIASGGEIDEALDNFRVRADGHDAAAEHLRIGFGAAAPGGMLAAHMELGLDGLVLAELPVSMAAYVPRHVKLRPFVSGISMADLTRMALAATEPGGPPGGTMPDPAEVFAHGAITFGLESLLIELADTALSGQAKFVATRPDSLAGTAQLTATNLDALMQKVQQDPMLQGGFPVLLMARGLGRQDGDKTVWNVAVDNGSVTVNGTDLSAMMGGMK